MAKFRTNHDRKGGNSHTQVVRVGLFAAIISALFFVFNRFLGDGVATSQPTIAHYDGSEEFFLPSSKLGILVPHKYYTLSYSEDHEQAEWVAYILTRERLEQPWVDRYDRFEEDPAVESGSASNEDYRGSSYERGHLVPSADMAFSEEAMRETFFMSNISPQSRNFNGGIWRELEELARNWAKGNKKLYVVTGPVLSQPGKGFIGNNEVTIPSAFFKVLLDITEPELKGIAFVLPNEISYDPLYKYAVSIDEVEALTGIDFFPELITEELEEELENKVNLDLWVFSKEKYETRINQWNRR